MSCIRVFAGPSPSSLVPISNLINTDTPHTISTNQFEGQVAVNIKGFIDPQGQVLDSEYFHRPDRRDITWSIQVQGRVLEPCSADDILFGNTFDSPLNLPWGSSAVLKLMTYKDPSLEHDIGSQTKPWALSPLISTMPHLSHSRLGCSNPSNHNGTTDDSVPPFPPRSSIKDDWSQMHLICSDDSTPYGPGLDSSSRSSSSSSLSQYSKANTKIKSKLKKTLDTASGHQKHHSGDTPPQTDGSAHSTRDLKSTQQRRKYFHDPEHRKRIVFGPHDILTMDFCHGYLEFSPSVILRLPGGISFDAMKHWDGQPVRFVCCKRKKTSSEAGILASGSGNDAESDPYGDILWCIQFELVKVEEDGSTNDESEDEKAFFQTI